jgi:NTE family protein
LTELAFNAVDDLHTEVLEDLRRDRAVPTPADVNRRPRIGVVFGAGGVLGNAYLSGAVAAMRMATGFEPRTASVIVGTSAGSIHAALYGCGMPALFGLWRALGGVLPADIMGAAPHPDQGEAHTLREIFTPARALPRLGPASLGLALRTVLQPWAYRPEVILSAWLPEGMFTNVTIGKALRRVVPEGWAPHPRTWITAVNLRSGAREVFGRPGAPRTNLARAVRASCSIPGLYRAVTIGPDRYIDGGMHSPSNADLLADVELDLVVIINPMSSLEGHAAVGVIDRYVYPLRRFAQRRLEAEVRLLRERGLPLLIIQPGAQDLEVFSRNLMDAKPRVRVAETAVETTLGSLQSAGASEAVDLLRVAASLAAKAET